MAALYKRYIPPTIPAEPEPPAKRRRKSPNDDSDNSDDPNYVLNVQTRGARAAKKRQRSEEEVAERKAKKLKKRVSYGVTPADTEGSKRSQEQEDGDVSFFTEGDSTVASIPSGSPQPSTHHGVDVPQSKFAHIKSRKKRHKLEKAARKAREEVEKLAKKNTDSGMPAQTESASRDTNAAVAGASPAKEKKKNRKSRQSDEAADGSDTLMLDEPSSADLEVGVAAEPQQDPSSSQIATVSQTKKRRHKLESVLAERPAETSIADENGEDHLKKHSGVLGKFQKSAKRSEQEHQEEPRKEVRPKTVVQNLELPDPIPQPAPEFQNEDAALPEWLSKPSIVSSDDRSDFKDLGLRSQMVERLSRLGFGQALPVQQALVPVLILPGSPGSAFLPGTEDIAPDVAVSAPTGSGKTIAYLLPIVEALRHGTSQGRLSALIIVPTRELVLQVAAVAESLAKGSPIRVGMATGNGKFEDQQKKLIKQGRHYDPEGYHNWMEEAKRLIHPPDEHSEDFDAYIEHSSEEDARFERRMRDTVHGLVEHVPTYESAVDILVATPGRLLEHVYNTVGFNLVHLQWLVIDEADKLLDNQYEGFLEALNMELSRGRTHEEQDARERYLRAQGLWDNARERRLRKVVLSATMTRDITKLTALRLRRPKMIVIRGSDPEISQAVGDGSNVQNAEGIELPRSLVEFCVPVGDGSEKPLVVIELLTSRILRESDPTTRLNEDVSEGDDESSSSSDDSSSLSSDSSDSSSESDDDANETSDQSAATDQEESALDAALSRRLASMKPLTQAPRPNTQRQTPTVLIFTSSNESANRLTHLLKGVKPEWASYITTIVKDNSRNVRIKSKPTEPAIVISTDRASRGLDNISGRQITHVVQYDVPRSLTLYVHRVGRTARAGRGGEAWTLFTHSEGKWFVNEVTKAKAIKRAVDVERVKFFMDDKKLRERYQTVLASMRNEVFGGGS